ncbi:Uncharacterised protein [BD1-7 clade bacterium]|uniref:Uncharacterized protein n=1 Tax=BD1-7 clade bacterium TaxID=2029982 RepID=A0A5S9NRM6_9GAMM|nr:Uncharacterised protein [BD1-7 clade bacterium]CAA0093156.1 Uncharacterised protein [BD1-7 clade bacterium]CAA0121745.1 Uncharacterised protein [BD1-7 clade bacterium]
MILVTINEKSLLLTYLNFGLNLTHVKYARIRHTTLNNHAFKQINAGSPLTCERHQ